MRSRRGHEHVASFAASKTSSLLAALLTSYHSLLPLNSASHDEPYSPARAAQPHYPPRHPFTFASLPARALRRALVAVLGQQDLARLRPTTTLLPLPPHREAPPCSGQGAQASARSRSKGVDVDRTRTEWVTSAQGEAGQDGLDGQVGR